MSRIKPKSVEEWVTKVLRNYPETRDDDMKLYAKVIHVFYSGYTKHMTANELLRKMYETKVPHLTSILRCRQLLQQHNKELRGDKYEERHAKAAEVKEDIINWNNDQSELFG